MFAAVLFFEAAAQKVGALVMKLLAVAGAFVVGYFVGGVLAWAMDRWVFAKKSPEFTRKMTRYVAALAAAIVVALILFSDGTGSGGLGGGSGDNFGGSPTGNGKSDNTSNPLPTPPTTTPNDQQPPKKKDTPVQAGRVEVRVTFLGGKSNVKDGRAYLIDDSEDRLTIDELKKAILQRREAAGATGVHLVFDRAGPEKIARRNVTVTEVEDWARGEKIAFSWPEDAGMPPP